MLQSQAPLSLLIIFHLFIITAATGLAVLLTAVPFLPGPHDPLAMPIGMVALLFGRIGLLLVIAGAVWMYAERSRTLSMGRRREVAVGALAVVMITWGVHVIAAFGASLLLGALLALAGLFALAAFLQRIDALDSDGRKSTLPLALIMVPILTTVIQAFVASPWSEAARDRAMVNGAPLIAEIERYRTERGIYPPSIAALHRDIHPGVLGIQRFDYEPAGEAYNLFFEAPNFRLGTQEVVVYNPRDEHAVTAHLLDVLRLSPDSLAVERTRGHYASKTAGRPHWKYYWFD